jgi:hypothetical protein
MASPPRRRSASVMASSGDRWLPKTTAGRVVLGFGLGWGPGLALAVICYFVTRRVPYSVLAFAVGTAITAVVLGRSDRSYRSVAPIDGTNVAAGRPADLSASLMRERILLTRPSGTSRGSRCSYTCVGGENGSSPSA